VQHYRFLLLVSNCLVAVLAISSPSIAQAPAEAGATNSEVIISSEFSKQKFHCHTGYTLADCHKEVAELKTVLARFHAEELGSWTWILVRSQEWRPILLQLGMNSQIPAFTAIDQRETFLEEALFGHEVLRTAELQREWLLPLKKLLELAVTHELGHALCGEPNEAIADRFGEELRRGRRPPCRTSKVAGGQSTQVRK